MAGSSDPYTRIEQPAEIAALLDGLLAPGGASLALEAGHATPLPVVVRSARVGDALWLDLTAIREDPRVAALRDGAGFRVIGSTGTLRTPVLTAVAVTDEDGRFLCRCGFPGWLEQIQRRDTFRARLYRSMAARVDVHAAGIAAVGWLRDLSLHGCLVEMEASAAVLLDDPQRALRLELTFPDGSRFASAARPRHRTTEDDRILCGFSLEVASREHERHLWMLVRETEREAARNAALGKADLPPSRLFGGTALTDRPDPDSDACRTPMARRLAHTATFLATQTAALREGKDIDPVSLSRHAERLLALMAEDREGLLFALAGLDHESRLIRHCLAVAARIADLGIASGLPPTLCKALAAAGMVHDLGKALLPAALRDAVRLDPEQYARMRGHVALIRQRLRACEWLPRITIEAVVEGANERLDGSGYPGGRRGGEMHALARLAAIVDVVDAMGRARADRPGMPIERVYAYLREHPAQFDRAWLDRYVHRFGAWPVGTLLRFPHGRLGRVLSLDGDGAPGAVQPVASATSVSVAAGTPLLGAALEQLGEPLGAVPIPG